MATGFVGGFAIPAVGAAMRALWKTLTTGREELLLTAFALDSVLIETVFTVGPLAAAVIIAAISPIAALGLCAACSLAGTAAFVAQRPSREWQPDAHPGSHGLLGALRSGGVRTLALATLPVGFCFGAVDISLPAFAVELGSPAWAGLLLAVWALGSALGGLAYGARAWSRPLPEIYVRLAALLPLGFLPALLAPNLALMLPLILPAGMFIAPLVAACNQLAGEVAPPGATTEAFTWPTTALIAGFAAGTAVGGALVEAVDWRAGFVAASLAATRRRDHRLRPPRIADAGAAAGLSPRVALGTVKEMAHPALDAFTPQVREWFGRAFDAPTPAQAQAWPAIATGEHTLISAPTGSGKTLAAFLWALDRLARRAERRAHAAGLRLAAQGALLRRREEPARAAARDRRATSTVGHPHGRHAAEGAARHGAPSARHPHHDARVALPDAHEPGARDLRRSRAGDRRRDPRGRADQARRASRAHARAARGAVRA